MRSVILHKPSCIEQHIFATVPTRGLGKLS